MRNIAVCLVSIFILYLAREFALTIPYTNQGFFCDDDEIRYPDRSSTVDSKVMHFYYFTIILIAVPLSELSLYMKFTRKSIAANGITQIPVKVIFFYVAYFCGVMANSVATNVLKRTASRLRPNFIAVCRPANLDQLCPTGSNAFVENFTCLGESRADEHYSFPSGHASHSLYFATFAILYLHRRFRMPNVIRAFSQFGVLLLSLFICLSRVRDFRHRYVDVAGGGMLGITVGMGMIHFVLFNFRHHRYHDHSEDSCDSSVNEQKRSLLRSQYGIIIDA